jgi:hypothetical protein
VIRIRSGEDAGATLDGGLVVRRGFPMRPVATRDTEPGDPVDRSSAGRAVEHELPEFPLEVGLHVQKLEPEHLGVQRDGMGVTESGVECFTDESVRSFSLVSHRPLRPLEGAFTTHRPALYGSATTGDAADPSIWLAVRRAAPR